MGARVRVSARLHLTILCVCLLLCAGLLWGLSMAVAQSGSPSPAASSGKVVLRIGTPGEFETLNPFIAQTAVSWEGIALNYDVLVGLDAATWEFSKETGLANDWGVSPDGKIWTFTLRRNAAWQDGSGPVTARDVAFTYNYIIDNDMAAFSSYTAGIKTVSAVDDYTVRMVCAQPKADMLATADAVSILPEHIWSKIPPNKAANSFANDPPVVGSGPFQIVEISKGSFERLVANKQYWRGAPKIDELILETYTNEDTMVQDLKAGTIDGCRNMPVVQLTALRTTPGVTSAVVQMNGYDNIVFNCYVPPAGGSSLGNPVLQDARFRQALQWAVDRQKLADVVFSGTTQPGDTVVVPGFSHNPDWHWTPPADTAYRFDLTKAGELLDAAGYLDTNGDGLRDFQGKPIALRLWSLSDHPTGQQEGKMLVGWFRQLGLKIDLRTVDSGAATDAIYNTVSGKLAPDFDLIIWGWYPGLDAGQGLSVFTTAQIGGWSDCGWSNEEFDQLYEEQLHAIDVGTRKQLIDRMQQLIYEQTPYIVLTTRSDTEAYDTGKWTGWVKSPARIGSALWQIIPENYLYVQPKTAGVVTQTGGGSSSTWIIVAVAAAAAAVIVLVLAIRRRKTRAVEEAA